MSRQDEQDPLTALRAENARLMALLEQQGIDWRRSAETSPLAPEPEALAPVERRQDRPFSPPVSQTIGS
jgi:hypothetical protein